MPQPSGTLSAFARRDTFEKVMFGFVHGVRRGYKRALTGVSEERIEEYISVEMALRDFATIFGLAPHEFNVSSHETVYRRMVKEFHEDQRTKADKPETRD